MSDQPTGTRILLVRHGRTVLNAEDRLRGLADPELDGTGRDQAEATANALIRYGITRVTSSPLVRARTTAEIIAEATGAARDVSDGFNDRDYGEWTGHLRSEVVDRFGRVDDAPGVEPMARVRNRALTALNTLARDPDHHVIAVVTHDAVIRPILETLHPGVHAAVPTASWAELLATEGTWEVIGVDHQPDGA